MKRIHLSNQAALYFFVAIFSFCNSCNAESKADKYIPSYLDKNNKYKTYSLIELYESTEEVAGISNNFVGNKVKVFGRWSKSNSEIYINKTRRKYFKEYGCELEICNFMEPISAHDMNTENFSKLSLSYTVSMYFKDTKKYKDFLLSTEKFCTETYPCYIWVLGTLNYTKSTVGNFFGRSDMRITYISVDDIHVIEGHNNSIIESMSLGLSVGAKIGTAISKFISWSK